MFHAVILCRTSLSILSFVNKNSSRTPGDAIIPCGPNYIIGEFMHCRVQGKLSQVLFLLPHPKKEEERWERRTKEKKKTLRKKERNEKKKLKEWSMQTACGTLLWIISCKKSEPQWIEQRRKWLSRSAEEKFEQEKAAHIQARKKRFERKQDNVLAMSKGDESVVLSVLLSAWRVTWELLRNRLLDE